MARVMPTTDRAADVRMVMERLGVDEVQAEFIVALAYGEVDGDVEFSRPVTAEERRRMGLDIVIGEESELDLDDDDDAPG
jgi:hypothetical protein